MSTARIRCVTLSDFNIGNLNAFLAKDEANPAVEVVETAYGQVQPLLMDKAADCWHERPDCALVWTRPQGVIDSFRRALENEIVDPRVLLAEVDAYVALLLGLENRVGTVLVPSWTVPVHHRGLGLLDMQDSMGIANLLMRMNLHLCNALRYRPDFFVLDARKWMESATRGGYNPKLWYMAKVPFANGVFKEAVKDVKAALQAVAGNSKKLVIVDLDDTLWGGIVGELGWENITLGGHDPEGEAFVDFQQALKSLTKRGILLAVVSKNEESVVLEAIASHPEMVLKAGDLAGWRINWNDKATNIIDLVADLNLGLDSAVFIDDNPAERGRVREALPEVYVPDWPEDKTLYQATLVSLRCFDTALLSLEDRKRTKMYTTERRRKQARRDIGSMEEWLESLGVTVVAEVLSEANLPRAAQLLNKTNQMNLTTRRMTAAELMEWASSEGRRLWTFRVSDRFGDLGLSGLISLEPQGETGQIVDFILSCRVFGRQVEEVMVATAMRHAADVALGEVRSVYLPTKKNKPCLDFWKRSGFATGDEKPNEFRRRTADGYSVPDHVRCEFR